MSHVSPSMAKLMILSVMGLVPIMAASEVGAQTPPRRPGVAAARPGAVSGRTRPVGYVPAHTKLASRRMAEAEPEIVEGGTYMEDPASGGLVLQSEAAVGGEEACCDDGSCGSCCLEPCCGLPLLPLTNLEFSVGVQGFTGPPNRGGTGSFGFHEAVNWGVPFPLFDTCLGMQFGYRATQSNLSGSAFTDEADVMRSDDTRHQNFVTLGLFRRVDLGLQGGIVVDYMNDTWYRDANVVNLRGELSWVFDGMSDLGCWFSVNTGESDEATALGNDDPVLETWQGTDLFAFFYRRQLGACRDGEARLFGGCTGNGDGLIGADGRLPLADRWALEAGFTYLIPNEGEGAGFDSGRVQESWNVALSLVWYPGRLLHGADPYYYRPLFRVADNGVFLIDRR